MKRLILVALLLTQTAFAVDVPTTQQYTANGTVMSATVYNSGLAAWQVVRNNTQVPFNMPSPCLASPTSSKQLIRTSTTGSVLFKNSMQYAVAPQNIDFTRIEFKACISIQTGTVNFPTLIYAQVKNLSTGVVTTSPTPMYTLPAGTYFNGPGIAVNYTWTLPAGLVKTGNMSNTEFGYVILGSGFFAPTPQAINMHAFYVTPVFTQTAQQTPPAGTLSVAGTLFTLSQPLNDPTNNEVLQIWVRCSNNVFVNLNASGFYRAPSPVVQAWSKSVLNGASYCGSQGGLNAGTSTLFKARNALTGAESFTNNVTVP